MSLLDGVCGTGTGTGPLPGDPDNNVILTAAATYGGIQVSWTYPTINPWAVSRIVLYRGTDSNFNNALQHKVVNGDSYFDKNDSAIPVTYYYWIQIFSIQGTENAVIGPASATLIPNVEQILELLTGQLDESQLVNALKTKIAEISAVNTSLLTEIENRILSNVALSDALAAVQTTSDELATYILDETNTRIAADSAQVTATNALAVGQNNLSAAIVNESTVRLAQDTALAEQITLLSAGAGEQFDYVKIWYFDSTVEGWVTTATGTTASVVGGWLKIVSDSGTVADANALSPSALAISGAQYTQLRIRLRKVGTPTWEGSVFFTTDTDNTWTVGKSITVAEPTYDTNGIGLVTINMPATWTAAIIEQIRLELSTSVSTTDYFEIDWVAVGRPSPGASSAQLLEEKLARIAEDTAIASDVSLLEASVNSPTTGLATKASVAEVATAKADAISAAATASQLLVSTIGGENLYTGTDPLTAGPGTYGVTAQTLKSVALGNPYQLVPGEKLTVSATLWQDATSLAAAQNATLYLFTTNASNVWKASAALTTVSLIGTELTGTVTLPADAADMVNVQIGLWHQGAAPNTAGSVFAERIQIERGSIATDYKVSNRILTSALLTEATTRSGADTTNANNISTLSSQVNHATTGLPAAHSAISSEASTRASADSANASAITTIESRLNRVVNYQVQAKGSSAAIGAFGFFAENGTQIYGGIRSYNLIVLNGATGAVISTAGYDVFGVGEQGGTAATLAAALNALGSDKVVVLFTYDEPQTHRTDSGLDAAMYRCGASRAVFGSAVFKFRSAYILVGIPGIGEGMGVERYVGAVDYDAGAWIDYQLQLINGRPVALGGNPLAAAVQTEAITRASETGELFAQYTVKVQAGGYVSGFGLASTLVNDTPYSEFAIVANAFSIAPVDTDNTAADGSPFFYRTTPTTINGVEVPAGAYMKAAFIHDASITNAKIANVIQSADYEAGLTGWKIDKAGEMEMNNAVFRGALSAATGTFSGSLTVDAINAVNTINIAGNAITVPVGVSAQNTVSVPYGSTFVTMISASITSSGGPIAITGFATMEVGGVSTDRNMRILRDSVDITGTVLVGQGRGASSLVIMDTPAAGAHTYELQGGCGLTAFTYSHRALTLLEVKR